MLSDSFINDEFLNILKDKKEVSMFQEYSKNNFEIHKLITNSHENNFLFDDILINQHLLCLEEKRLFEKRRNDEIKLLLQANELIQKNDESLNAKIKESEENLKQLNLQVKSQIQTLLAEKSKMLKNCIIQIVQQNIQTEEKNIVLWQDLQSKITQGSKNQSLEI